MSILSLIFVACGTKKSAPSDQYQESGCGTVSRIVVSAENSEDTTRVHMDYCFYMKEDALKPICDSLVKAELNRYTDVSDSMDVLPLDYMYLNWIISRFEADYVEASSYVDSQMSPWAWDVNFGFLEVRKDLVVYSFSGWAYTGGAHGNQNNAYYVLSKKRGKIVGLKDICTNIPQLTQVAETYFREQNIVDSTQTWEEQGFWFPNNAFQLNENFYFTADYLVFFYNQYEIGPYSMGVFMVEIPIKEISSYLREDI